MSSEKVALGLQKNLGQFTLLVVVNAFVGAMVGLERSIFPEFAETAFGISSSSAILSFIVAFGITKAMANYFAGAWANRIGRRKLLVVGWIFALPIPLILLYAPSWSWVVFANVLLGINQGLAWSSTVVMKIDLVGDKNRGLAMGLNEFSGYLAVGLTALATGFIAERYGITPYPFYMGFGIAVGGFLLSVLWVRDTRHFVKTESHSAKHLELKNVFVETTFKNKTLSSVTQAGLVNNLNDGMIWGLFPMLLLNIGFNIAQVGTLAAVYPTVWGLGQLFTGKMADHVDNKKMLFWGMGLQGLAIAALTQTSSFYAIAALAALLGLGTALVYPTFLTVIASKVHPGQRAKSIGSFRLWRDLGYAFGALISGVIADVWSIPAAVLSIGVITLFSALVIQIRMPQSA